MDKNAVIRHTVALPTTIRRSLVERKLKMRSSVVMDMSLNVNSQYLKKLHQSYAKSQRSSITSIETVMESKKANKDNKTIL